MTWTNIPKNWTGDQALAVVEFLDEISAMIWFVHEIKMLDAWHERNSKSANSEEDDSVHRTTSSATSKCQNTDDFPF